MKVFGTLATACIFAGAVALGAQAASIKVAYDADPVSLIHLNHF